jgi:glycerophosphoryl diester phosphodiesterase
VKIPLLDEVFARFPSMRMNIEIKSPDTRLSQLLCALIHQRGMSQKILVASFHSEAMSVFRKECPEVATSMTATEARVFYALYFVGLSGTYSPDAQALQNALPHRRAHYRHARFHTSRAPP